MNKLFSTIVLLSLCMFCEYVKADECQSACQTQLIHQYFEKLGVVFRADSSEADINEFLSLMHDGVKYIHVEYGADFDLTTWKEAFMRNHKRGAYRNKANQFLKVNRIIHGKTHAAVEYTYATKSEDGSVATEQPMLVLFAVEDKKLSLIKEYW